MDDGLRPVTAAGLGLGLDTPHSGLGSVTSPSTSGSFHGAWSPGHTQQRGRLPSGPLLPTPASSSQVRVPLPGRRRAALGGPDPNRATGHASHSQRRSVPAPPRPASCKLLSGRPAHPSTRPQQQRATQPSGHRTESRPGPGADVSEPRGATAWNPGGVQPPRRSPAPHAQPTPPLGQGTPTRAWASVGLAPRPQPRPPNPRRRWRPGSCPQTYLTNLSTCDMDAS